MSEHALAQLPEDWQEILVTNYSDGASDTEIRAELKITYGKWQQLMMDSDEFRETVILGRQLSKAWWLKQGRTNLMTRHYNAYLWYKNMQNRFGWSEKQTSNVVDAPVAGEDDGYDDGAADDYLSELLQDEGLSKH